MHWTLERLEEANGKYLFFTKSQRCCLLQKSSMGWKIGDSRQATSTRVALQMLNYQQATLAFKSVHV